MNGVLRLTGLPQLYSFYRHFAFNMPRATTGGGILLLLGVGVVHLYLLLTTPVLPGYFAAYLALVFAAALAASAGMLVRAKAAVIRTGWALGALTATSAFAMYIVSRTIGLPGLELYVARWDYALGTFTLLLDVGFVGLYLTVLTGVNVAWPQWRYWRD